MTQNVLPDPGWLVVINPNAGNRKGEKDWPVIRDWLLKYSVVHHPVWTRHRGHAIVLVRDFIGKGYRKILTVGGDGTLNEVFNGIAGQDAVPVSRFTMAIIPVGTGNDWCRMFGISFDYEKAVKQLIQCKTMFQDTGKATFYSGGELNTRYFMNVAGLGYDALVANRTNRLKDKGRGGPLTYLWYVFTSLIDFRFMDAVIEVDGKNVFKGELFSMNVGICRYNGGGMMQVPQAIPDDGFLDVTLIVRAPKWMVIRYAHKLYNGTLIRLPIVRTYRGENIRIRSTGTIYLETDGESMGHTPLGFSVIPASIRVVCGDPVAWQSASSGVNPVAVLPDKMD